MTAPVHGAQAGRLSSPVFVHSALDDAGLTPRAFRVYGHLARRAGGPANVAFPGLDSMAVTCRMDRRTVLSALRELLARGMVRRESRPGRTSIYSLTPVETWTRCNYSPGSKTHPGHKMHQDPVQKMHQDLGQKTDHEGIPIRISKKVIPSAPPGGGADFFASDGVMNPDTSRTATGDGRHHAITSSIGDVYHDVTGEEFPFSEKFPRALKKFLTGWKGTADEFLNRYRQALELRSNQFAGQCRRACDPAFLCQNWPLVSAEIESLTKPAQSQRRAVPMKNTV